MVEQLTARDRAAEARYRLWQMLDQPWDLVVIGGGITGAGVLLEAARMGYRAVLLEQRDFAWGTSSRSGKLVHGGLRYLRQGQVRLTWQSVRERERLLREAPGLVLPLGIVFPDFRGAPVSGRLLRLGLVIYDVMAMRWGHRRCSPPELQGIFPHVRIRDLKGGLWYRDAVTDDARLVLRVIREAERRGALALNYARVHELRRTRSGRVEGVAVRDLLTGRTAEVKARVVVNAAGIWADEVRAWLGRAPRLRLLRGSHLVFPAWRLPVSQGINLFHPVDGRPLYVLPWDGVTLVGTTDLDYDGDLAAEPAITPAELDYLLTAANYLFPSLGLSEKDVLATFSGVRGVVGTGRKDPSRESREHAIWAEGIITVAGGKLTTFRILALDALRRALEQLGPPRWDRRRVSSPAGGGEAWVDPDAIPEPARQRLVARYGPDAFDLARLARPDELDPIPGSNVLRVELRWAAAREAVWHLDDLMLRRVRLGVQLPSGGAALLERIRSIVQPELGWDDHRWAAEVHRYTQLWRAAYSLPLASHAGRP